MGRWAVSQKRIMIHFSKPGSDPGNEVGPRPQSSVARWCSIYRRKIEREKKRLCTTTLLQVRKMNVSKRILPFGFLFLFLFLLSSFGKDSQRISIDTVLLEERFKIRKLSKIQADSLKWAFADIAAQRREIIQGRLCGAGANLRPTTYTHHTNVYKIR